MARLLPYIPFVILVVTILQQSVEATLAREQQLEQKITILTNNINNVTATLEKLEIMVLKNVAEQKLEKTILAIQANEQGEATKFWKELLLHIPQSSVNSKLSEVISLSYAGKRENFYFILTFLQSNSLYYAFPMLSQQLMSYKHQYGGQEIFVLGYVSLQACGNETSIHRNLPSVVKHIISGSVTFQSADNKGILIAPTYTPCTDNKYNCYDMPKNEVIMNRSPPSSEFDKPEAHWRFYLPTDIGLNTYGNESNSGGFIIKNVHHDKFLVSKLRITSYFLRANTSFPSYYAGFLQSQFQPTLTMDIKENQVLVGIREKNVFRQDYWYVKRFDKVKVLQMERRGLWNGKEGFTWNVKPIYSSSANDNINPNAIVRNPSIQCTY